MKKGLAILLYGDLQVENKTCTPDEARQMAHKMNVRNNFNCRVDYCTEDYGLPTCSFVIDRGKVKKVRYGR